MSFISNTECIIHVRRVDINDLRNTKNSILVAKFNIQRMADVLEVFFTENR